MKYSLFLLTQFFYLQTVLATTTHKYEAETILDCNGVSPKEESLPFPPKFGKKIRITINQLTDDINFSWNIRVLGTVEEQQKTNGPISSDGITTSEGESDRGLFYDGLASKILIRRDLRKELKGEFRYMQTTFDPEAGLDRHFLVNYRISCQRTPTEIDDTESIIYNGKFDLEALTLHTSPSWMLGIGVKVSGSLKAEGIVAYARDREQEKEFLTEFSNRGVIGVNDDDSMFFMTSNEDRVPLEIEITGDIGLP